MGQQSWDIRQITSILTFADPVKQQLVLVRMILSASGANEVSEEDEALGHGVFTYDLLEVLRGGADKDGLITVDEAYSYVSRHVPEATGQEQHPVRRGPVEGRLIIGVRQ